MPLPRRLAVLAALAPAALLLAQIPAVGADDADRVAGRDANGLTRPQLDHLLSSDPSAHLDDDGRVYFVEPVIPAAAGPGEPEGIAPFPVNQTFLLHSNPTSTRTLFIDVDGTNVSGTVWNSSKALPAADYPGWDPAGNGPAFTDAEKEEVQKLWQRVAEDYAPFGVDVTTEDPGFAGINRENGGDTVYGTRALVSPSDTAETALCGGVNKCGGIAYINVYGEVGGSHQPAWVFPQELGPNDTKNIAEAISHEVGHNFGLQHDGRTSPVEGYYTGHAMWAPIMGVGYQRPVSQWSKGEYTSANNTSQDDVALIAAKAPFRTDEAGSTTATAAPALPTVGYITNAADTDTFVLGTCSGAVTLTATGAVPSPDLDIQLELLNATGTVVSTNNPASAYVSRDNATGLSASITANVATGAYYARVDGVGNGTGATGYTDYGSIGAYSIAATGCNAVAAVPGAPRNLQVTVNPSGTAATMTWTAPASDGGSPILGYTVDRTGAAPADQVTLSKTWTGLTPGANYLFSVSARNAIGTGPAASQAATMAFSPTAPTNVQVIPAANGQSATVTWSPPASDGGSPVTGYTLTRTGGAPVDVGVVGTYAWTGLTSGSTYTFTVAAKNAAGTGPTATKTATMPTPAADPTGPGNPPQAAVAPGAPTIGAAKGGRPGGKKTASVSWTAPANTGGSALTGYRVLVFDKSGQLVSTFSVSAGKTTYKARLKRGKYTFAVVALNSVGASPQSAQSKRVLAR